MKAQCLHTICRMAERGINTVSFFTLLVIGFCGPQIARGQLTAGVLRMYQGGVEIGGERFGEVGRTLYDTIDLPVVRQRVISRIERSADGRLFRADTWSYTLDTLRTTRTTVLDRDTVRTTFTRGSRAPAASAAWIGTAVPDDIVPGMRSSALLLRLLEQAPRQDRSWKVESIADDTVFSIQASWRGDTAVVSIGSDQLVFYVDAMGRVSRVIRPADGNGYVISISPVRYERFTGTAPAPFPDQGHPQPDYQAPLGAPYVAIEVTVPAHTSSGTPFTLGCTLTRPGSGDERVPAVVTINGSGPGDRDEDEWPLVRGYHLYGQIADHLARVGVAVLRCDKRGSGASRATVDTASPLRQYVNDAAAELAFLRARSDIDPSRLGVIGHSLGGMIGPLVAVEDPELRALVVLAGPAKALALFTQDQFVYPAEHLPGLTDAQRAIARATALREAADYANRPALRWWHDYDPIATAARVHQPVLILHGEADRNVSVGQADTLAAAMRAGGNANVTVRRFSGLNHFFLASPSGTGAFEEYGTLTDVAVPVDVLDALASWLVRALRR